MPRRQLHHATGHDRTHDFQGLESAVSCTALGSHNVSDGSTSTPLIPRRLQPANRRSGRIERPLDRIGGGNLACAIPRYGAGWNDVGRAGADRGGAVPHNAGDAAVDRPRSGDCLFAARDRAVAHGARHFNRSMCWAPSVDGDEVTMRRLALSKRPCRLARRSAASRAGTGGSQPVVHLKPTSAPGSAGRRFRASSRSLRDHAGGGSDLDRRATIGLFPACAACKSWNHRDRAWRRLSRRVARDGDVEAL